MTLSCLVDYPGLEERPSVIGLSGLVELLKANPEGLYRYPYFFSVEKLDEAKAALAAGTLPLTGPLVVTHAIRRAAGMLLEEAAFEGMNLQIEVQGHRLPELPARPELENLLNQESTLVIIDGKPYKPATEVLGFQNVYDDTVRFIDNLKKLGIPQNALYLMATAEEITVEVHPGVFGLEPNPHLPLLFTALLYRIGGVKRGSHGLIKTWDRTLVLGTTTSTYRILIPGSVHPALHRPKVAVGQSHFAYGIAAFSDFCGKKRTLDECLKEVKNWLKFLQSEVEAVPKLKETMATLKQQTLEASKASATGNSSGISASGYHGQPARTSLSGAPGVDHGGIAAPDSSGISSSIGSTTTSNHYSSLSTVAPLAGSSGVISSALDQSLDTSIQAVTSSLSHGPSVAAGGFRPFAQEIRDFPPNWEAPSNGLSMPFPELNRALGGGLPVPSLHVIAGAREEGKAALLLNLAIHATAQASVLYISRDHAIFEFVSRLSAWATKTPLPDLALKRTTSGPEAAQYREKLNAGLAAALKGVGDHLFFRGTDSTIDPLDIDGVAQLVKMLPSGRPRLLILESLELMSGTAKDFRSDLPSRLARLARDLELVIALSLHLPTTNLPRPHFVDGPDLELLAAWQPYAETITHIQSEKINLKKFLAMSYGKVEATMLEKLENRFRQATSDVRLKSDTYSILRVLHARQGARMAILALYQRDLQRFIEGPAIPLCRP